MKSVPISEYEYNVPEHRILSDHVFVSHDVKHVTCSVYLSNFNKSVLPSVNSHLMTDHTSPDIQEVIDYCASRLRASIPKISDDRLTPRSWWQVCFVLELVSVPILLSNGNPDN